MESINAGHAAAKKHMSMDFDISVDDGITRVAYRGDIIFERTAEMLRKVGQIAAEHQSTMLLIDAHNVGEGPYATNAVLHATKLDSYGIDRHFRIAFLGHAGDPKLEHVENVLTNRGFRVKVFFDEAAAVAWLRSTG